MKLKLEILEELFCIYRLDINENIPQWVYKNDWYSITKTKDELSIVCSQENLKETLKHEKDWKCFKVSGTLDFSLIGILSNISTLMANNSISIFAISTYDTDYILVKNFDMNKAIEIFTKNNIEIIKNEK